MLKRKVHPLLFTNTFTITVTTYKRTLGDEVLGLLETVHCDARDHFELMTVFNPCLRVERVLRCHLSAKNMYRVDCEARLL